MTGIGSNSVHLVTPVVHCVGNVHPRDAYDAPPGAAPLSRFLQANRLANRGLDRFEPSAIHEHTTTPHESASSTMNTPLLPNLGEVLTTKPERIVAITETTVQPRIVPATGRVLDLYA